MLGEEIAEVVAKVAAPVVAMTPVLEGMDTDAAGARPEPTMGPGQPSPSPDVPLVFDANDQQEQQYEAEKKRHADEEQKLKWAAGAFQQFAHPIDPVDDEDFDDTTEKQIIVALSLFAENPVAWQSECIAVWRQLVEAAAEFNRVHPSQQAMVKQQYPEMFKYLADHPDTVLMAWEVEFSTEDQWETITACEVLLAERLEQQQGRLWMTPDLEQCMTPEVGSGAAQAADTKQVPRQGIPILHNEKGLFATVLAEADYGESDLMDNQHTHSVSEGSVRSARVQ